LQARLNLHFAGVVPFGDMSGEAPKTPPSSNQPFPKSPANLPGFGTPRKEAPPKKATSVFLWVPLITPDSDDAPNVIIDFMRQAEEKYGYEALHPDARNALDILNDADENDLDDDEADDIDLMADSGGQASTQKPSAAATQPAKNRGRVEGKYDLADPFIDDSELLWEEQAASTKDGFFVYSGPLVQEGEHPQIERADGTIKRGKDGAIQSSANKKATSRAKRKDPSSGGSAPKKAKTTKPAESKPAKPKAPKTKTSDKAKNDKPKAGDSKPETKPDLKSETKPDTKPDTKQETKPETKPEAQPENKQTSIPEKSAAKPEKKVDATPMTNGNGDRQIESQPKYDSKPSPVLAVKPPTQPPREKGSPSIASLLS
jgi:hypothetical protein